MNPLVIVDEEAQGRQVHCAPETSLRRFPIIIQPGHFARVAIDLGAPSRAPDPTPFILPGGD